MYFLGQARRNVRRSGGADENVAARSFPFVLLRPNRLDLLEGPAVSVAVDAAAATAVRGVLTMAVVEGVGWYRKARSVLVVECIGVGGEEEEEEEEYI